MNKMTSLPSDVDTLLMDIAQMFETQPSIDYADIMKFAERADNDSIQSIRAHLEDAAEFDFDITEDEVQLSFDAVASLVKGENVLNSFQNP